MKKNTITLSESQLREIIKNTLLESIDELGTYADADAKWGGQSFGSKVRRAFNPNAAKRFDRLYQKGQNLKAADDERFAQENPSIAYYFNNSDDPDPRDRGVEACGKMSDWAEKQGLVEPIRKYPIDGSDADKGAWEKERRDNYNAVKGISDINAGRQDFHSASSPMAQKYRKH